MIDKPVKSRLFEGLDAEELAAVLQAAQERRFAASSEIVRQTQRADHMFLLTHGRARHFFITRNGDRVLLRWLVPGDAIGGRALLPKPLPYYVSAEALKDSRFLVWDRPTLQHLTARYPRFLRNTIYIADDYLGWFLTAHTARSCFTARQRCASVLKSLALTIGRKVQKGVEVEITDEDLADASAITLFAASRFVSDWRRCGAIVKPRGKILVRSFNLLAEEIRK
jgi:CRP/FNR family transcriptional regulator, nitrogen oxide reductase regulator